MKTEERRAPDIRDSAPSRLSPHGAGFTQPLRCQSLDRAPCAAPFAAALHTSLREQHRESEKLGLIEMLLGAERYRSILEIGCGTGELAGRLIDRCARYTGMDEEAARLASAARAVRAGRFVPLRLDADEPFALPPGEHDLVVLSDTLCRIDARRLERLATALGAHAPCREIVVVSPVRSSDEEGRWRADRDDASPDDDGDVERRLTALASGVARLERHALALRGHYRIDALLPPDETLAPDACGTNE